MVVEFESFLGTFEANFRERSLCIFQVWIKEIFGGVLVKHVLSLSYEDGNVKGVEIFK